MLRNLEPGMGFFDFAPALILLGAGLGLSMSPLTTAATTAVPISEVGMSSGLLNLTRNIGGAFGIALFGTLLTNATNSSVLSVAQNSVIHSHVASVIAQGAELIILKGYLLAYGEVFSVAAFAMLIGGFIGLILLRAQGDGSQLTAEARAEAMAG
jgi:hypothetical protein